VLGVLQVQQEQLDRTYLERAAQQRGVSDLLEQALRESDKEEKPGSSGLDH